MRRYIFVVAALLLGLGLMSVAVAGVGPNRGLPSITIVATNLNKWSVTGTSDNNAGSAMCVDCHTSNPAAYLPAASYPGGSFNEDFIGTHFVARDFATTNSGGGYAGSKAGARTAEEYMKTDAWTSGGLSKYGAISGGTVSSTTTENALICESCHNIVKNTGKYKLLAAGEINGVSTICGGCHADMQQAVNNEPSYFAADNVGNHHHRNTTLDTEYGGSATLVAHDMGAIAAADYGPPSRLWAASTGQLKGLDRDVAFASADDVGIKNGTFTSGQITISDSAVIECLNCHRAHGAYSGVGALILQTGDNTAVTWGKLTSPADKTTAYQVLSRQSDNGDPSTAANRLIKDDRKLCAGCHTGYGQ